MQGLRDTKSITRVDEKNNAIKFRVRSYPEMVWNNGARTNNHTTLHRKNKSTRCRPFGNRILTSSKRCMATDNGPKS